MKTLKAVDTLTEADLKRSPVWAFTDAAETKLDETAVRPLRTIPVKNLNGRVVGTQVTLANGTQRWALVGNVRPNNPRMTEHLITLSVLDKGRWFPLARYHDLGRRKYGPAALAAFLGLPIDAVFPIHYDIRRSCKGDPAALAGSVEKRPKERLTRSQIIGLAVPPKSEYKGW